MDTLNSIMSHSLNNESLHSLLDRGETARLECKASRGGLPRSFWETDFGRQGVVVEKTFRHVSISNPGCLRIRREVAIAGGTYGIGVKQRSVEILEIAPDGKDGR